MGQFFLTLKNLDLLKELFTSNVRVKLLKQFFLNPKEEFFVRELSRILDEQVNAVRRELDAMKKIWLLKSSDRNRKKFYFLNEHFLIYPELSSIILKNFVVDVDIHKDLLKLWTIDYLSLTGIFVDKQSSVDLFVVWDLDPEAVQDYLKKELWEKDVKFAVISKEEFTYRLDINDSFLLSIVRDKSAVVPINKFKKKLEKYV